MSAYLGIRRCVENNGKGLTVGYSSINSMNLIKIKGSLNSKKNLNGNKMKLTNRLMFASRFDSRKGISSLNTTRECQILKMLFN